MSTEPEHVTRPRRIRRYWWVFAAAAVVSTAVAVTMSAVTIGLAQGEPRALVTHYLTALQHGKAEDAMKLGGIRHSSADILLSDTAYAKATDRITSFRVEGPVTRGATTTVSATILQGGNKRRQTFTVEHSGGIPGLPLWKLAPVSVDTVAFEVHGPEGTTYSVAGIQPKSQPLGTTVTLRALPGTYPVAFASVSKNYRIAGADVASTPAGETTASRFVAQLSPDGETAARHAIDMWLDGCVASSNTAPDACPFLVDATTSDGLSVGSVHWTLDDRPTVTVAAGWSNGGWAVASGTGTVTASATLTRPTDGATGQGRTDPISFGYAGVITFGADGAAVFTPQFNDGSSQG